MELWKYHFNDSVMERVQVWFDKVKVTREKRQEGGCEFEVEHMHLPPEKIFLGECEATTEAVAGIAGVEVYYARRALERMGECFWVFSEELGSESIEYYLLVLPAEVKRSRLI